MVDSQPTSRGILAGLLVVDKPLGWSSMDVIRRLRSASGASKAGHAGTLDPLATGVLVCCLGPATRLVERLVGLTKIYETDVDLSAFTETDDREGPRQEVDVQTPPVREVVEAALAGFVGEVEQRPPIYSAIKVGGRRAYKMARKGQEVEMPRRVVRIDRMELLGYDWPVARLRVTCGKGTYIRSVARDLGVKLGTGGHLAALRRTAIGPFDLTMAVGGERFQRPITQGDLISMERVMGMT